MHAQTKAPALCALTHAHTHAHTTQRTLGLRLEPAAEGQTQVTFDADANVVRIPLRDVEGASKRTKLVMFTCNKCGEWGVVFVRVLARACVTSCTHARAAAA